ncbi:hypothetical protein [Flexivirga caeni]|uniref:hypothetical protein n=1 Tax=Flexivirga caeni TaxID=2294115 RepID=UPI00131519BB|nr:hypothetical protein [Flexivirga caeni]
MTGASSGFGAEFAQQIATAGLHPIVVALIRKVNDRTVSRLRTHLNERARTTRKDRT